MLQWSKQTPIHQEPTPGPELDLASMRIEQEERKEKKRNGNVLDNEWRVSLM